MRAASHYLSLLMNRFERIPLATGEAQLRYLDGDFRIVRPGSYVRCAVTGDAIPLDELKYWSVERQEAYAGPDAVMARLHPDRKPR
jgi:hypothetical protein